ncbi:hypothetical protein [Azospirillum picis]|uniref:Uncharacterized protein n=1 Tax=Azospirillum picis TaxID=488438 RepID=A0ABU0MST6_9PROT|nr:hypothetical protein [Azospirillum picis]MBP2302505.1 hypothetical protein [Azospirillum picis]MDQ0536253.1 hypothetical protein [Azospirillum picis]
MPKPQFSARVHVQETLSQDQILCLLTADAEGDVYPDAADIPGWLIGECQDLGLMMPGHCPGVRRLTDDGRDARDALLSD